MSRKMSSRFILSLTAAARPPPIEIALKIDIVGVLAIGVVCQQLYSINMKNQLLLLTSASACLSEEWARRYIPIFLRKYTIRKKKERNESKRPSNVCWTKLDLL